MVPGAQERALALCELAAVVVMVMVVVTAAEPLGVTEVGEKLHVDSDGKPEHVKLTAALNPFCGVILRVAVPVLPGATLMVGLFAPTVKSGGAGGAI